MVAARLLIGDAWASVTGCRSCGERVKAGEVMAWKAREVAHRTSSSPGAVRWVVDRIMTGQVELLAWGRFEKLLDATLLQVDEKTYQQRAARAAAQRDVRATQSGDGLRTLVARVDAGDATAFLALVNRVAECLAEDGDEDPVAVRRSKAVGIIAYQATVAGPAGPPRRTSPMLSPPRRSRSAAYQADLTDPLG